MKTNKIRIFFLSFIIAFMLLPLSVSADDERTFSYTLSPNSDGTNTYSLTIGLSDDTDETYIDVHGSELADGYMDKITRVTVEEGVEELSPSCFSKFSVLKSVHLPSTLNTIGNKAFYRCYCLNDITVPSGVSSIGESAFSDCGADPSSIELPAYLSKGEKARIYYDVHSDSYLDPGDTEARTYLEQFDEAYDRVCEILDGLPLEGKSDFQKVKLIYDWITEHVAYDYNAYSQDQDSQVLRYAATAHSALFNQKAVCSGYSELTKMMLNEAGIDCVECTGTSRGQGHAWEIIKVDGKWYAADSTWDAGLEDGYLFFLETREYFNETHTWDRNDDFFKSSYPTGQVGYLDQKCPSAELIDVLPDGNSFTAKWAEAGEGTSYQLKYWMQGDEDHPEYIYIDDSSITQTTVPDLQPNTMYIVAMRTYKLRDGISCFDQEKYDSDPDSVVEIWRSYGTHIYVGVTENEPVEKKDNPMTLKVKAAKIKFKTLRKKALIIKPVTVNGAEGKVTYKQIGITAKARKVLKFNTNNGKITIKKGTKRGSYKIKIKVTALGTAEYKSKSKNATVKVTVK